MKNSKYECAYKYTGRTYMLLIASTPFVHVDWPCLCRHCILFVV